jgi:hypothetical protein
MEKGKKENKTGRSTNDHRIEKKVLWKKEEHGNNCNGRESKKEEGKGIKSKKDIKERKN